jgi:Flp pilus assembly protein CpaB
VKKKNPPYAIIGAVVLGIIAIVLFVQWTKGQAAAEQAREDKLRSDMQAQIDAAKTAQAPVVAETPTNMRPVLYATQPVEAGQKISPAFFETKQTPNEILPDAYTQQSDIVGFYAIRKIEKGDPLTPRNIGKSLPYMSQRISPGMRAVSLQVFNAELNETGGFIVDGDRVDLLFTQWSAENASSLIDTSLVMQNLSVLFVPGPQIKTDKTDGIVPAPPPGDPVSVTFEVTPEQAQALIFMTHIKNGQFSMILRARKDKEEIKVKAFEAQDYYGNLQKVQRTTDKSLVRVQELAAKIEAAEKTQGSQGNTNETSTPTPPNP